MITAAAVCLFLVGLMHSYLGGRKLIAPLMERKDFPIILGSQRNGRLTLYFGWHALTLFWWAQAIVLVAITVRPSLVIPMTLLSLAVACAIMGALALIASRGRHLSWIFFLPISVLLLTAVTT